MGDTMLALTNELKRESSKIRRGSLTVPVIKDVPSNTSNRRKSTLGNADSDIFGFLESTQNDDFWQDMTEYEFDDKNAVSQKSGIMEQMTKCSQWLLMVTISTILQSVLDIELQYAKSTAVVVAADFCSETTQKTTKYNELGQSLLIAFHCNRCVLSLLSLANLGLVLWYAKLEVNLLEVKQCKEERNWSSFIKFVLDIPTDFKRLLFWLEILIAVFHESNFMYKTYFVKFPILTNAALYAYCVFILSYSVFVLERRYGAYKTYFECVWMMSVTLPDLGFGDYTPQYAPCRILVALAGLLGVLQTGLITHTVAQQLSLTREETKILCFVERHNINFDHANSAARLIQLRWRLNSARRKKFFSN